MKQHGEVQMTPTTPALVERLRVKTYDVGIAIGYVYTEEEHAEVLAALTPSAPTPTCGWQAIDSAPKDSTMILAVRVEKKPKRGNIAFVFWEDDGNGWCDEFGHRKLKPTHWQPIPDPPAVSRHGEAE